MTPSTTLFLVLSGIGFAALWNSNAADLRSQITTALITILGIALLLAWMSPKALGRLIAILRVRKYVLDQSIQAERTARARFRRKPAPKVVQTWPRRHPVEISRVDA